MKNNLSLLNAMLEDQKKLEAVYTPGEYWSDYAQRTSQAIYSNGLEKFRSNSRISKGYGDNVLMDPFELMPNKSIKHKIHKVVRNSPPIKKYIIQPYRKQSDRFFNDAQKYKDLYYTETIGDWFSDFSKNHNLPETLHGDPQQVVSIHGKKIGLSYLISFLRIHNFSKDIDFTKLNSVFEIGGGFGAFSHSLMHLYPNIKKYLYLDIPPIVYVGNQYLTHFYPDNVINYLDTKNQETITFSDSNDREIISLCPWQIENFKGNIDLFWNSASFQEMTESIVKNYVTHLNKMIHDKSKICLMAYKIGDEQKTLSPERIIEIITEKLSMKFDSCDIEMNINNDLHFLGRN